MLPSQLFLSLGLEELFIILTVSCLASSVSSTGRDCTAFSTPPKMSSIGTERGVTASLRLSVVMRIVHHPASGH